ncbi:MAG: PQQ-binding-like beta-propeller repeat protein [Verrucomicrobia bacterium]|nr:PQQ-binding-like beta-propeller repeat protein [Verrucomicrobiota bacterium]
MRISLVVVALQGVVQAAATGNWAVYLGDDERSHYSTLTEINAANVHRLKVAWTYRSGDFEPSMRTQIQCNPLVVDGVFFGTTALQVVVALEAATGRELWRFDPKKSGRSNTRDVRHRGLVYWARAGERRLILAQDHFLYAIAPDSGKLIESFGEGGMLDFKKGWASERGEFLLNSGTPGVVYEDLYIMPVRTTESHAGAAPGHVRAYNIRTGALVWTFHTIPRPGEYGYETWPPDAWKTIGGANCWAGMSLDKERGLLYVPTGSATYDFWGGYRIGNNLFANSLVCLNVRTGKRVWHFQMVRHDLWDRDLPAPPNLFTLRRGGQAIPAVAQTTKSGHIFVFNRETGEPLFPIEDRPVPSSDIPGEVTAPTQPWPLKPASISRQSVSYDDLTTLTPGAHKAAVERFSRLRQYLPFQPPSREGSIVAPGLDGGAEWGGAAMDPAGVMYVNGSEAPWILTMVEGSAGSSATQSELARGHYLQSCTACHGADLSGNRLQNIPALAGVATRLSREEIVAQITNGKGAMPAFGFLPKVTIGMIADYLVSPVVGKPVAVAQSVPPSGASGAGSSATAVGGQFSPVTTTSTIPWVVGRHERFTDADGYPAVKPPWGTLNAIDLNTGEYLWKVPLGEYPELTARGIPLTGTNNYGGPVVTAGGVVFIAATSDSMIRAFDSKTGRTLWQAPLPTGGYATPSTYLAGGRQYLVIACGGGKLGSKSDDAYVAFALPDGRRASGPPP